MPYDIRPAAESDVPGLCAVFFDAYGLDRVLDDETRGAVQQFFHEMAPAELRDPGSHVLAMTDPTKDDKTIALAIWHAPKYRDNSASSPEQQQQPGIQQVPVPAAGSQDASKDGSTASAPNPGLVAFQESRAREDAKHEEIMKGAPHWYLNILAVASDYKGKGLGGRLLRWGMELAEIDGVPQFLIASEAGKRLYAKHGFEVLETFVFTDGIGREHVNTAMLWTPPRRA